MNFLKFPFTTIKTLREISDSKKSCSFLTVAIPFLTPSTKYLTSIFFEKPEINQLNLR